MTESYDLDRPQRLTVGTVGEPGRRIFLLQAVRDWQVVTLKLEKAQVAALAQYLAQMLEEVGRPGDLPTDMELLEPTEPEWVIGSLGVSYDEDESAFVIVAEEAVAEDDVGAVARIGATLEQIAALAIRGTQLVESGRPPCPLCGYPLDPVEHHACPRTNGNRPPGL